METRLITRLTISFGLLVSAAALLHAGSDVLNSRTGLVQVFVKNQSGTALPSAPVYISDGAKTIYLETDVLGAVALDTREGNYTISSAMSKPSVTAETIDRYGSPEAHVSVAAQDTTTVVLILRPIDTPVYNLSATALRKIGVADEVAKYVN